MNLTLGQIQDNVLTEKEAIIFLLVSKEALSQRKIAETLGISKDTVGRIVEKARAILE